MAIKMQYARTAESGRVSAEEAERFEKKLVFSCDGKQCAAQVSHVGSYTAQHGETTRLVRAFFRITANRTHGEHCQYDVKQQIEVLARDSDPEVITKNSTGLEFRLLAVSNALNPTVASRNVGAEGLVAVDPKSVALMKSSDSKLPKYLNSAVRIIKLRNAVDDERDLAQITIRFDKKSIKWSQFYFEPETYLKCALIKVEFPRALFGIVDSRKQLPDGRAVLNLKRFSCSAQQNESRAEWDSIAPAIWATDLGDFDAYPDGTEIVAFGHWRPGKEIKRTPSAGRTYNNHAINMKLIWRSQIAVID
jgi:hypothetical protein